MLSLKDRQKNAVYRAYIMALQHFIYAHDFTIRIRATLIYSAAYQTFNLYQTSLCNLLNIDYIENMPFVEVQPQISDGPKTMPSKKKWTVEDLLEFDSTATVDLAKTYHIAGYINASDRNIFENIPAISILLSVLCERISQDILITIKQKHSAITSSMHINRVFIIAKLQQHVCSTCSEFLTVFELTKGALTPAERMKIYHAKYQTELKQKARTEKSIAEKKESNRQRYKASLFPPKPSTKDLITDIVDGSHQETSFSNIQEHGCAVCGAMTPVQDLISLDIIDQSLLSYLQVPDVTRQERHSKSQPI